jgi:HK97 gp10 family phage protein
MAIAEFNHFNQIADALPKVLSKVVRKAAFDIQARAVSGAPVDTGFLRNSIYTVTIDGSSYGTGKATVQYTKKGNVTKATVKNFYKATQQTLLPEISEVPDETTAYVAVGADYGIYLEFGTRYMPAQPYFYPAVEAVRPGFEAALSAIEPELQGMIG